MCNRNLGYHDKNMPIGPVIPQLYNQPFKIERQEFSSQKALEIDNESNF